MACKSLSLEEKEMRRAYPQGHPEQPTEYCCDCKEPTGKAGVGDGSIYCDCGKGPFCEGCYDDHISNCAVWLYSNVKR